MSILRIDPAQRGEIIDGIYVRDGRTARPRKGNLSPRLVRSVDDLVRITGVLERVEEWRRDDNVGYRVKGGRPAVLTDRQILVVLLALVYSGEPALLTDITEAIRSRLSRESRELLHLPERETYSHQARYHQVARAYTRLTSVMEPHPGLAGRKRLTKAEVTRRIAVTDGADLREARGHWFANQFLEATITLLPDDVRERWDGSVSIDATKSAVWGKRGTPPSKRTTSDDDLLASPDPTAGWYHRDADHRDPLDGHGKRHPTSEWAREVHLGVTCSEHEASQAGFPFMVAAMSLDKPAGRVAENAMTILKSLHDRGHPAGDFVADRAYLPNAKPEKLQLPARALGYSPIMDYRIDQLGLQGHDESGALWVEGGLFCPGMPQELIDATKTFRTDEDLTTYRRRIEQRQRHRLHPKEPANEAGVSREACPAIGTCPTTTCSLRGQNPAANATGRATALPLTVVFTPPSNPGRVCTNRSSVSIKATSGAKYRQDVLYGSDEWHRRYSRPRNSVESFNSYVKDRTKEDLEDAGRRRVRGWAKQLVLITAMVVSANLRKLAVFLTELANPPQRKTRKQQDRHPDDLRNWRPTPGAPPGIIRRRVA